MALLRRFLHAPVLSAAWLVGEDATGAARTMLAHHGRTASLNAGWPMGAIAGALGVTLSKRGLYQLEGGPAEPETTAINRALRVADTAAILGIAGLGCIQLITIFEENRR